MSGEAAQGGFDVVVVIDTTGSMDSYILALQRFIPQLLALRNITSASSTGNPIERVGILSYTDYYTPPVANPAQLSVVNPVPTSDAAAKALIPRLKVEDVVSWSGWLDGNSPGGTEVLIEWAKGLNAEGGGDYPEAAKTALKFLIGLVGPSSPGGRNEAVGEQHDKPSAGHRDQPTRETLVLWYTDSPPHHLWHRSINRILEIAAHNPPPESSFTTATPLINKEISSRALNQSAPHPKKPESQPENGGGSYLHGEYCTDWVHLCRAANEIGMTVYTILPPSMSDSDASFWVMLGGITGGGTCAIGGKRTVAGSSQDAVSSGVLDSYTTGGGDFVRAVIKLSLGIVLGALVDVVTDEGDLSTAITADAKGKGKAAEGDISPEDKDANLDIPPEIQGVRWLSHRLADLEELLDDGRSTSLEPSVKENTSMSEGIPDVITRADPDPPTKSPKTSRSHPLGFLKRINKRLLARLRSAHQRVSSQRPPDLADEIGGKKTTPDEGPSLPPSLPAGGPLPSSPPLDTASEEPKKESPPAPRLVEDEEYASRTFLPPPWTERFQREPDLRQILREGAFETAIGRHVSTSFKSSFREITKGSGGDVAGERKHWDVIMAGLKSVIGADVEAISTVSIFTEVWIKASKSPPSDARDALFSAYLAQVSGIRDTEKKERLLKWASIDNDASAEVTRLLGGHKTESSVPANQPNQGQILVMDDEVSELALTRERVLALTTSCDKRTLKDVGHMLRYTKLVPPTDVAPSARSINPSVVEPSAIFRVLPHLLIQGTLYSPRTASICAIIALASHIPHLLEPAKIYLETTKGTWINSGTPENFTVQFIGFMLSVPASQSVLLSPNDHATYSGMARYAHLEENIDTKIQAKVPWTPMKTRGVGDRKRVCDGCGIRRSETMMHQVGSYVLGNMKADKDELEEKRDDGMRCGMCVDSDTKDPKDWKDQGEIRSCWVECSERWCRAQYVIEDEEGLRIPPRCYYCRKRKPSPWMECIRCANRIILPKSYRVLPNDSPSTFVCPPCANAEHTGHQTVVHKLTTLRSILFANEYEVAWLGIRPFREIFRGRSTFVIWEIYGSEVFTPLVPSLTPSPPISPSTATERRKRLVLSGKKLMNPQDIKEELDDIVGRATKKGKVLCGISFDYCSKEDIVPACGNSDCEFLASKAGLKEWYAGTGPRRKLCPSCRLWPTAEALAVFG